MLSARVLACGLQIQQRRLQQKVHHHANRFADLCSLLFIAAACRRSASEACSARGSAQEAAGGELPRARPQGTAPFFSPPAPTRSPSETALLCRCRWERRNRFVHIAVDVIAQRLLVWQTPELAHFVAHQPPVICAPCCCCCCCIGPICSP